jgi:hypothetical protein
MNSYTTRLLRISGDFAENIDDLVAINVDRATQLNCIFRHCLLSRIPRYRLEFSNAFFNARLSVQKTGRSRSSTTCSSRLYVAGPFCHCLCEYLQMSGKRRNGCRRFLRVDSSFFLMLHEFLYHPTHRDENAIGDGRPSFSKCSL